MKDATTDQATIRTWWSKWPDANVGIATGPESGIWAFDVDPRHGGDVSLEGLGELECKVRQQTGGGGEHLIFAYPNGRKVVSRNDLWPGIDVKGAGGYIVAPPSVHESGRAYRWLLDEDPTDGAEPGPASTGLLDAACFDTRIGSNNGNGAEPVEELTEDARSELCSALECIPAHDRDLWLRVGMALKQLGDVGYKVWSDWSSKSPKYDADDQARVWESLTITSNGVTLGTVYHLAREAGWRRDSGGPGGASVTLTQARDLVESAVSAGDPGVVYESIELFGNLSLADEVPLLARMKKAFGGAFDKTSFRRATAEVRSEVQRKGKRQRAKAAGARMQEAANSLGRSQIFLFDGKGQRDPKLVHDESVEALRVSSLLYMRGASLARVVRSSDDGLFIQILDEKMLEAELMGCALFIGQGADGAPQPARPPQSTIRTILGAAERPFRELAGITRVPVLRPDGTVLSQPGYDESTGLLYVPQADLVVPSILEEPTAEDASAALGSLQELYREFPFADEASRANALGVLITPFVQPAIRALRPMAVVNARQSSSGKSLLLESTSLAATGRQDTRSRLGTPEENEKKIGDLLQRGVPFITFDNVKRRVECATLESVLTSHRHSDRVLGHNDRGFDVPQDAVWCLTGNNVEMGSEMRRRSFLIDLDPKDPNPESREGPRPGESFRDLPSWALCNRARLIAAALTACRAWWVAGRPTPELKPFGSFETWQRTIGGILAYGGVNGFLGNRDKLRVAQDEEALQAEVFLRGILDEKGARGRALEFTVRELFPAGPECSSLAEYLPDELSDTPSWKEGRFFQRLGSFFRRIKGRRFAADGLRIEVAGEDAHCRVRRWRVVIDE